MTPHIRKWRLVADFGDADPETGFGCIVAGTIYSHSDFHDGEYIFTSPIVSRDGFTVRTKSGSTYILAGPPDSLDDFIAQQPNLAHTFPTLDSLYKRKKNDKEK